MQDLDESARARQLRHSARLVEVSPDEFRQQMKMVRELRGWSQRQLSEHLKEIGLKLDPSAVTRIENGQREPKYREAVAISEALVMSLNPAAERDRSLVTDGLVLVDSYMRVVDDLRDFADRVRSNPDESVSVTGVEDLLDAIPEAEIEASLGESTSLRITLPTKDGRSDDPKT